MKTIIYITIFTFLMVGLFMYLVILGGNINISENERKIEDEEQIEYLKKYNRRNLK